MLVFDSVATSLRSVPDWRKDDVEARILLLAMFDHPLVTVLLVDERAIG